MKVVLFAGGYGTRLGEGSSTYPKPMVEIGGKPLLWHIMKHYEFYGFTDFVVLCGYMGDYIRQYFANYYLNTSNVTFDLAKNSMEVISSQVEPWRVTLLDTGVATLTGGRLLQAKDVLGDARFLLTYGDGVSNLDIHKLIESHDSSGKVVTLSGVLPKGRFGALDINTNDEVTSFKEKPTGEFGRVNGGFYVCEPEVFDYLVRYKEAMLEAGPLENLAKDKKLHCYKHDGFWRCVDTLADYNELLRLWEAGTAAWKIW